MLTDDHEFKPGDVIAHYEVLSLLGEGGMGKVYLAQDARLNRKVGLKILPMQLANNQERMRRFTQEAKTAAALNHANIAHIFEIGEQNNTRFIAMEYVEGETLRQLLSRRKQETKRAVEFAAQVASGLSAAHKEGVIHRDIKPENLMVTTNGQIKILDFGLAKIIEKQKDVAGVNDLTTAYLPSSGRAETTPGVIMGTVSYMSPEQARGEKLDQRTDIFSLGVVLYEMVTSKRPFDGKSAIDTLHAIINQEPPSITKLNSQLPPELGDILAKALAKEPPERYQHAGDFELDLRRFKRALESNTLISTHTLAVPEKKRIPRVSALWLVVAALMVFSATAVAWLRGRSSASKRAVALENVTLTPLTTDPGYEGEPTFSPDGQTIAYVSDRTGNFEIFLKQISGGPDINLTNNKADEVQPAFSPDGKQIAFVSTRDSARELFYRNANFPLQGGGIWVMTALGGPARKIVESGNFPSWSPDGSAIIFSGGPQGSQKLFSVSAQGGAAHEVPLNFNTVNQSQQNLFYPSYSANGKWIVFELQQGDSIFVVGANGGEPQLVGKGRCPVWNQNSTAIVYSSGEPGKNFSLWQVPFALNEGKVTGDAEPLTVSRGRDTQAAVSRDGKLVAFAAQDVEFNLEKIPYEAESGRLMGTATAITSGHNLNYFFDVAPDGRAVVYESHSGTGYHIWRSDEGGTNQLTADANFDDRSPRWSPDGRTIIFGRRKVTETEVETSLWMMSADGANPQLVHPRASNFKWMPDGRHIIFDSSVDRQFYSLDVQDKRTQSITNEPGITGVFSISSDGQWIVYQSTLKGLDMDVRAVKTSGGPSQGVVEVSTLDGHPFISPSGKWLYFQRDHKNIFRVPGPAQGWRQAMPEQITHFPESGLFLEDPQSSKDGRWLFYSRARITSDIWIMRLGK